MYVCNNNYVVWCARLFDTGQLLVVIWKTNLPLALFGANIKQNRWFQPAFKPGKILVLVNENVPKPNQRPLIRLFSPFTPDFCPIFFALSHLDEKKFTVFAIISLPFFPLKVEKETNSFSFLFTCPTSVDKHYVVAM